MWLGGYAHAAVRGAADPLICPGPLNLVFIWATMVVREFSLILPIWLAASSPILRTRQINDACLTWRAYSTLRTPKTLTKIT